MKQFRGLLLSLLVLLLTVSTGTLAETADKYAVDGEQLVLFDQDGVKLYLTGEYTEIEGANDSVYINLHCVAENNSDQNISIKYTGTVNGWSLDSNYLMTGATDIAAGSKSKCEIWFSSDVTEAHSYAELEEMHLTFIVEIGQITLLFEADPGTIHFHADPADAAAESIETEAAQGADAAAETAAANEYSRDVVIPGNSYPTLDVGSKGDDVKALQQALIDQGFLQGGADGVYGNGTAGGVKAFQESVGLAATGAADDETQRKLYGDEGGEVITITLTGTYETDYMQVDGIFVDESYTDEKNDSLVMLYFFYTVSTPDQNLKLDSKDSKLTFDGVNTYTSEHYNMACTYMSSYYYKDYLRDVYMGENLKVVETFKVPKAELAAGRALTFVNSAVPDSDKISLLTDNIVVCDSAKTIAKVIDPEGCADMEYQLADADADTRAKVKSAINGYYWTFYVNNFAYKIEFAGDGYTLTTTITTTTGTYTVKNGFIVLVNDYTGAVTNIPYYWGTNDIVLELADGFDVREA